MANNYYTNKIVKLALDQYIKLKNGHTVSGYEYNSNDAFLLDIQSLIDNFYTKDEVTNLISNKLSSDVIATGIIPSGSLNTSDDTYLWIVYPLWPFDNTFSFNIDSSSYTGYHFAIIQGGHPGCIRYFSNTTTLKSAGTTSIAFPKGIRYVRFKVW